MAVVIKLIIACLVCSLVLREDENFVNSTGWDSDEDDELSAEWTSDNDDDEPQGCPHFYEYCPNPKATYKSETSLKGKKMPTYGPDELSSQDYVKVRCFCDSDCNLHGDCCYDQQPINSSNGEPIHLADPEIRWECHRTPFKTTASKTEDIDIMLVSSCPSDYQDDNFIQQCQRHSVPSSQYDHMMDVPVVSLTTNRTYVNVYCAMCNNDIYIHQFNITYNCPKEVSNCSQVENSWEYIRGENKWKIRQNNAWVNISSDVELDIGDQAYYKRFNARKCRPDVIRECPPDWPDKKTRALCSAYSLLVRSNSNMKIYKNEHCAVCNGQARSQDNLVCPQTAETVPPVGSGGGGWSFTQLFDFFGGGKVGETLKCRQQVCKHGEICDHLAGKCRNYTCGRLYAMDTNGKCVRNNAIEKSNSSNLNDNCFKIHVHQPEFIRLPNDSIYVNSTSKTYVFNEHEVINETTVLICADNGFYNFGKFTVEQEILSKIGVGISLLCLAVHIFIYVFLPQLRNIHGMNVLSLSCCLFVAQLCFQFGLQLETEFTACVAIAMTVHFGFLASFFWMNILAIDMYRTFVSKSSYSFTDGVWGKYKMYALYAWLTPLVVVVLALINDLTPSIPPLQPNYGKDLCWINNRDALLIYFAGPLGLLLLVNMGFFLMTVIKLQKASKVSKMARENSTARDKGIANDLIRAILFTKLAVIMGLMWIVGFIAALTDATVLWYAFIIFNSLQGAFIFIAFSCKPSMFQLVRDKICRLMGRPTNVKTRKGVTNQTQLTAVTPNKASSDETLERS